MATAKERLDKLLVERDLVPSREKAQALIMAGKVKVEDAPCTKPGSRISLEARIEVTGKDHPYVSRGGVKLEAALTAFDLHVEGVSALDIGASTGGFTHCLLLHGAAKVYAVDVGYGQLAWEVRQDPRVVVMERTNIRNLSTEALDEPVDLVVVDVSFIALTTVLRDAVRFMKPSGAVVALVKPQFEAGREHVRRGGRVTDQAVHQDVLQKVAQAGASLGLHLVGHLPSPITGRKSGNVEYLMLLKGQPENSNEGSGA